MRLLKNPISYVLIFSFLGYYLNRFIQGNKTSEQHLTEQELKIANNPELANLEKQKDEAARLEAEKYKRDSIHAVNMSIIENFRA
jgi:hypothetical protein